MTKIRQRLNQKGFTLVELMVVIAILGVLAAIAIPKFGDATATANTAKIQADLRTIDAAIVMHQAQLGKDPADVDALVTAGLLVGKPNPPSGKCFVGGETPVPVPKDKYEFENSADTGNTLRAICGEKNTSDTFKKKS